MQIKLKRREYVFRHVKHLNINQINIQLQICSSPLVKSWDGGAVESIIFKHTSYIGGTVLWPPSQLFKTESYYRYAPNVLLFYCLFSFLLLLLCFVNLFNF